METRLGMRHTRNNQNKCGGSHLKNSCQRKNPVHKNNWQSANTSKKAATNQTIKKLIAKKKYGSTEANNKDD